MKLRVTVDEENRLLELTREGENLHYKLQGAPEATGDASVIETQPGVFSVLLGPRSYAVRIAANGESLEAWTGQRRYSISIADARDRSARSRKPAGSGPLELRAQMPGKVVKLLVEPGAHVHSGQGLVVVEAMKMQNEVKSPKDGAVTRIYAVEGTTVLAGEKLIVVE